MFVDVHWTRSNFLSSLSCRNFANSNHANVDAESIKHANVDAESICHQAASILQQHASEMGFNQFHGRSVLEGNQRDLTDFETRESDRLKFG